MCGCVCVCHALLRRQVQRISECVSQPTLETPSVDTLLTTVAQHTAGLVCQAAESTGHSHTRQGHSKALGTTRHSLGPVTGNNTSQEVLPHVLCCTQHAWDLCEAHSSVFCTLILYLLKGASSCVGTYVHVCVCVCVYRVPRLYKIRYVSSTQP